MQRSLFRYTTAFLLPLLAVGLVLTGCDSTGSNMDDNGGDSGNEDIAIQGMYPDPSSASSYADEVAINLQSAGLGIRLENDPSASILQEIYTGPSSDRSIRRISGSSLTFDQTTYSYLGGGVDPSAAISTDNLLRSHRLESADTDHAGEQ